LDSLKLAYTHSANSQIDIRTDEQEENISNISGNNEDEIKLKKNDSLKKTESDKRKLKKFFENLYSYFHSDILFKDTKMTNYKLTLTVMTKYLIALELIHEFGGKSEKIETEQRFFTYLPITGCYKNNNVKGCCLNIVGDFLRLAQNGFKEYKFDYTRKKFEQLQHDALISTIACMLNINWKESERHYFKTLLLNSLHYLGWTSFSELDDKLNTLVEQLNDKVKRLKQPASTLKSQLDYFVHQMCDAFKHSLIKREKKNFANSAREGQIIYSSIAKVGYCYVISVTSKNEYCLARPGFDWSDQGSEYINHFGDTIYNPLSLNGMIIVDV
jgi:hypothetical protein